MAANEMMTVTDAQVLTRDQFAQECRVYDGPHDRWAHDALNEAIAIAWPSRGAHDHDGNPVLTPGDAESIRREVIAGHGRGRDRLGRTWMQIAQMRREAHRGGTLVDLATREGWRLPYGYSASEEEG